MKKLKDELVKLKPEDRLYQVAHPVIGLTGGIATGKTTVSRLFAKEGIPVVSADALVKTVYEKIETIKFINENWPSAVNKNEVDFSILRKIAFSEDSNREKIEQFIYARMSEAFKEHYSMFKNPSLMVYDVPLLFEKGLAPLVDISICVYAPREIQVKRLLERDGTNLELAEKILSAQIDIEDKKEAADFIIDNSRGLDELNSNFKKLLKKIS
ncbi:MAG: dephospho-CoA kinase [Halobacteriovorax sp.]|nr:dephospho-CoA kinase [Halobacteriovorax sp.]|tara:strand:+ start:77027 stop:77665 length:639 start_codon:yes stop_codon:yes gene_type:complete